MADNMTNDLYNQAKNAEQTIKEAKKIFYDLETDSANPHGIGTHAVTFSAYSSETGKTYGGAGNEVLIDYGDMIQNIAYAQAAMNLRIKGTDQLVESAVQMRKLLLQADDVIDSYEKNKGQLQEGTKEYEAVVKAYKEKGKTITAILKDLKDPKTFGFESSQKIQMIGYNNSDFDDNVMQQIAAAYQGAAQKQVKRKTNDLFGKGKTVDLRQTVAKTFEKKGLSGTQFSGVLKLQDLNKLITGAVSDAAHSADDDVATTALLEEELKKPNNIIEKFAQAMVKGYQKRGLNNFNTQKGSDYRKLWEDVYNQVFEEAQLTRQNRGNIDDISVEEIVKKLTINPVSTGGKQPSASSSSKSSSPSTTSGKGGRFPRDVKNEMDKKLTEAQNFAKSVISQAEKSGNKKAQNALNGTHIQQRGQMLGQDFQNLNKINATDYLAQIYEQADKWGIGVVAQVDGDQLKVGFYPKDQGFSGDWGDIANVSLGLVDDKGMIRSGSGTVANLMYTTLKWFDTSDGKRTASPALITSMEMQLKNIANLFGYNREDDNPTDFTKNILGGNIRTASSSMKFAGRRALSGAPTTQQNKNVEEAMSQIWGEKNPEQLATMLGMVSNSDLASSFYAQFKDWVNDVYAQQHTAQGRKGNPQTIDPYNLTPEEESRFNVAYALISKLDDNQLYEEAQKLSGDKILQQMLSGEDFGLLRKNIRSFAANGLTPNFEGIKEETFLANLFSILGSKDILPLNALGDFSNRSLSQSFNYQPRAKTNIAQNGKQSIFSSDIGRALGVDYNSLERSQYYGSTTNDEELLKAAQELSSVYTDLEGFMASVKEGGVIMSADMAKQLTSYKETYSKELGKKAASSLQKRFGVDPDKLSKLAIGETVTVSDNFRNITGQSTLGGVKVKAGDQVLGFRKTVNGIQAIIKQMDKVKNGSKILTEGGERLTARVLPTEIFNAIADKLGKGGAQYLTETHGMQSRKYMPELSGRFSYMVQEALANNKSIEEIYDIMKEVAPTWANMLKLVNGKFESNFFLDNKTGTYKYFDADGKIAELLSDGENSARKAWVEDSENSELSALGKKLLGESTYNATRGLLAQAVNMAKDAAYFESSGYSNADTREQSRVKFASREREAFKRGILGSQEAVKDKEGLAAYARVEDKIQNTYGKEGQKAQKTIENLKLFYENTPNRNELKRQAGVEKVVTLKWGGADESKGEVDISQALADFDWENGSVSKDQYEKSAMALAREFVATHSGYDVSAPVILDLTGAPGVGNNTYSVLSDIAPVETAEGGYIPSLTDKVISQIIRAVQTGEREEVTAAFENATKSIKEITTSKDSELVKAATESKVPNASYLKAVGINTALANNSVKGGGTLQNTAFITSNRLRSLLSSSKEGSKEERKAALIQNVKNLSWMYRAGAGEDKIVDKDGRILDLKADLTETASSIKDLSNIEKELIENIIAAVKSGQMDITGQIHRYPSTSGLDIHHTKIAIDDMNTSDDAVEIGRGMSIAMNADYDGDKTWLRAAMASGGYDNYEQYKKAYDAARNLREIEDRIANDLGEWEKRKDAEKAAKGESDEQLVKDLSNRNPNWYAALMSKSNKKYVGQFSNMASRVRGAMSKTGFDEMGGTAAGEAKLIRAFYEVFEQDSISAKKVFARLSKENGEDVAVDELTKLFDTLMRGNMEQIKDAIAQAQKMGIIGEMLDTRQFQNARFTIKETDPEMYEAMGLDKSEDISVETLLSALSHFNDVMIKQGFGGIENASKYNFALDNKAIKPVNVRVAKAKRSDTTTGEVQTKSSQRKLAETAKEAAALANSFVSIPSEEIVIDNSNGKHNSAFRGFTNDDIDSVTTLLKRLIPGRQDESQMSFKDREMLRVSSAKGTFMHGLMELIGKEANAGRTVNAEDLIGTAEYQKLESDLQKELGLAANVDVIAQLRKRVNATAEIGRREGLIGKNVLQEVNLGGYFTDSIGGVGSRGIKGTADVISYQKDENSKIKNAKVGDWKFSQDSSPETFLERLLQANIYLGIEEKKVKDSIDKLEEIKKNNNGILTDEDEAKLQELTQQRDALANGEIEIVRNHNRDGQIVNETSLAKRLSSEDIFSLLRALLNGDIATATQFAGKAAGNVISRKYYDESGNETFSQDAWNSVKAQTSQQVSDLKEAGVAYKELINLEAEIASMKARGNSEDQEEIAYLQQILNTRKQELGIQENQNLTKDTFLQALQEKHKAIIENIQALEGLTEEQKRSLRDSVTTEYNRRRRGVNKAFTAYDKVGAVNTKDFEILQKGWFSGQQTANRLKNDIAIAQAKSRGMSGQQAIQQANYIARLQQSLNDVQMNSPSLTKNQNGDYVLKSGEKEIVASKEQALNIQKQINELTREEANNQLRLGNNIQQNVGFLDKLKENFKMSFSQIGNYIMGYASFQGIQNVIRQVTSATEQLDQRMVDLQIASGYTRDEINSLMYDFNRLGTEMGKTTQEMAEAANDWLRAGYEGAEVTQLTQSSMQLATLGMINSADATSYLISVLKGWKLEASEVNNIVDKLTAVDMAAA